MLLSFFFIIVLPVVIAYLGAFTEYLVDVNTDINDWYRRPTLMVIIFGQITAMALSVVLGIFNLADYYHIVLK
jgi:hypothetical protein